MNRYKIKIIKIYDFDLSGYDKSDIEDKVDTIMKNNLLRLQESYNECQTIVKIKKIGKEKNNNEKSG